MYRALLFLSAESPVHAGADSAVGAVDLPIQREASTRLPVVWGQSLKGALRDHCAHAWRDIAGLTERVFGSAPPGTEPTGSATGSVKPGSLAVGDAQLLAFPAPTLVETFAWVTSPLALARLSRKAALLDRADVPSAVPEPRGATALAAESNADGDTVLGPYVLTRQTDAATGEWGSWLARSALPPGDVHAFFAGKLARSLFTVTDSVFTAVSTECVELTARVQLTPEKTVKQGPFYTEYLPTETILAALLETRDKSHLDAVKNCLDGQVLRVGGDETIGKGLAWCRFVNGDGTP
jgi:CRISPR-associated protein Cmr4